MTDQNRRRPLTKLAAATVFAAATMTALPAAAENPYGGYELRAGVLAHDRGIFSGSQQDGVDINGQLLFPSPHFLRGLGSPRPHIGVSIATSGISQAFAGLTWDWNINDRFYLTGQLGGAVHNGDDLDPPGGVDEPGEKYLGCQVLFHLAVGAGYRINERWNVQLYADHISNATLCSSNEGLENTGIRVGYRF